MCFSAPASFTASAVLIPIGIYCAKESLRKDRSYLFLALLPLVFGIQQFFEGLLWMSFNCGDGSNIKIFSYVFLFFAFALWPFYSPFTVYNIEEESGRERLLLFLTVAGALLGVLIYLPLVIGTTSFTTSIVNRSIAYETGRATVLKNIYTVAYIIVAVLPFMIASGKKVRTFGTLLIGSILLTLGFFNYAFFSVWCFFAALLSSYILYVVHDLEEENSRDDDQG